VKAGGQGFSGLAGSASPDPGTGNRSSSPDSGLRLVNLLNDAETLAVLLPEQVESEDWLDAFLLAAGLDQVVQDAIHAAPLSLDRIAARLDKEAAGPPGRAVARAVEWAGAAAWGLRARWVRSSLLSACGVQSTNLAAHLADIVIGGRDHPSEQAKRALSQQASTLSRSVARLSTRIRETPLRLPSAFRNLDLTPEDVDNLMREVMSRWPEPGRPLLVVGIRTAGSYLVPLAVSAFRAGGRRAVRGLTLRPGQRWDQRERELLRWAADVRALVVLVDDPPNTWTTVVDTFRLLQRSGLERSSIVPALHTFSTTLPPPGSLPAESLVLMSWDRHDVQQRLGPRRVKAELERMLQGTEVVRAVEKLPADFGGGTRGHARALYSVRFEAADRGRKQRICVHGVGLGYMGRHALAVSERLPSFLPRVYGVAGGLMFREWLPEELRVRQTDADEGVARAIVEYVVARARALPVDSDVSRRLRGRPSLWRGVGRFLSQPFGRTQVVAWPLFQAWTRELFRVRKPSVVDARTGLSSWFREDLEGGRLKKIGFSEWSFSAYDTHCYDPVFDLAGAAASEDSGSFQDRLPEIYSKQTGEKVDAERWLLYQLVHLADHDIESEVRTPETERRMSVRVLRYFRDLLLDDVERPSRGPLCALDLDGVLESTPLGISATNVDGALALRALHAHGYRPVIASGRSLPEVRERCLSYRAAGGVAEYGAAMYVAATDQSYELTTAQEREAIDRLRSTLDGTPDVEVDPTHRFAVRAYRLDRRGRRHALRDEEIGEALARTQGAPLRAIQGQAQTDFVVDRVTKGNGLQALAERLRGPSGDLPAIVMAVGDTAADLPMLELVEHAFAPANADQALRRAGVAVLHRPCQAGLMEAAARLLGHRPGGCPACRMPALPLRSSTLLKVLSPPQEGSVQAKATWSAGVVANLAWHLARSRFRQD
jgi:hydroxymethylpyrimidine pyrophosphatase-like HAD family hydrolase